MAEVLKITEVMKGVHVLDELGRDNMWLVEGGDRCLLVDTGFGLSDLKKVAAALTGKPVVVVNSHIHPDHSSGNIQFDEARCGRFDEPFAHEEMPDEAKRETIKFFPEIGETGIRPEDWKAGPAKRVIPLREGDVIDLGGGVKIEIYETPGHTPGSLALLDRAHRLLFTGDMILTWQVWGQLKNSVALRVYLESLEKIASLKSEYDFLAPGHSTGAPYLIGNEVPDIYVRGTRKIVAGEVDGEAFHTFAGDGRCVYFEVGGMVYDPARI